jgi:hypothetical protein
LLGLGCAPPPPETRAHPIIYGGDDRKEYFEVGPDLQARISQSMVALIPKTALELGPESVAVTARTWAQAGELCPDERFADQPAAAFCSGILVDWDLVLTSGHCTRAFALDDFAVVFGYHYAESGKLAVSVDDLFDVSTIVSERLSQASSNRPRIDYAWLRLSRRARPPREPAPLRTSAAAVAAGALLIFAGASGGVPIKADSGGVVKSTGEPWFDYFTASTDSFRGASGGGAFDGELALLGALERGGPDLMMTPAGCAGTYRESDGAAQEEFTFVRRALEGLCAKPSESSLCRPDCGDPCRALPGPDPTPPAADSGCSMGRGLTAPRKAWLLLLLCFFGRRRKTDASGVARATELNVRHRSPPSS